MAMAFVCSRMFSHYCLMGHYEAKILDRTPCFVWKIDSAGWLYIRMEVKCPIAAKYK
jgi:hypothetical protein